MGTNLRIKAYIFKFVPIKPLSFQEYISIKSYVSTLNHVLRMFRHVKIVIKKCFENKWLILKVKFIMETYKL